jgi:hypothetical protein
VLLYFLLSANCGKRHFVSFSLKKAHNSQFHAEEQMYSRRSVNQFVTKRESIRDEARIKLRRSANNKTLRFFHIFHIRYWQGLLSRPFFIWGTPIIPPASGVCSSFFKEEVT